MIRRVLVGAAIGGCCLALTGCDSDASGDSAKSELRDPPAEKVPAPGPELGKADEQRDDASGG